jgi:leucyl-tRNA synthetase
VNGKVRAKAKLSKSLGKEELEKIAMQNEAVKANIGDKKIIKVIAVPGKLVNVVAAG